MQWPSHEMGRRTRHGQPQPPFRSHSPSRPPGPPPPQASAAAGPLRSHGPRSGRRQPDTQQASSASHLSPPELLSAPALPGGQRPSAPTWPLRPPVRRSAWERTPRQPPGTYSAPNGAGSAKDTGSAPRRRASSCCQVRLWPPPAPAGPPLGSRGPRTNSQGPGQASG